MERWQRIPSSSIFYNCRPVDQKTAQAIFTPMAFPSNLQQRSKKPSACDPDSEPLLLQVKQKISATHSTPSNALMALFASSSDSNETNAKPRLIPDSRSLTMIFFLNDDLVSRGSFPRFAEGVELGSQLTSSATLPCCLNSLRRVSSVMYGDSLLRFG